MELRTQAFKYFDKEIREFLELYLSKTADVNITALSENFINEHEGELDEDDEDIVFDLASVWIDLQIEKGNIDSKTLKWVN